MIPRQAGMVTCRPSEIRPHHAAPLVTYRTTLRVTVGTVKKSIATKSMRWSLRNADRHFLVEVVEVLAPVVVVVAVIVAVVMRVASAPPTVVAAGTARPSR